MIAAGLSRLTTALLALNTKVDAGLVPVTDTATAAAGDVIIIKRGSAFYLALVDPLLGGGGGASLPYAVVAPEQGLEVMVADDGVWKRSPIAKLINEAYPASLGLWDYWTDWRAGSGNAAAPGSFVGAAVSSGTNNTAIPTAGMAGYNDHGVFLRSSTTANGGYRYQTTSLVGMYFGVIARKFRCQWLPKLFTGVTVRLGFHDTNTSADATDGAYFEIAGNTCSAKTANNSTRTNHATTITLALDTAYTFDIEVNAAANEARFRVWGGNDYATPLMDVTIATNIPSTSARSFGAGIVATESSTTATDIGILYSLGLGTPAGFARLAGGYAAPAVLPSAFTAPDWSATATAGGIDINVGTMPAAGSGAVTAIRYRVAGGAPVTLAGTGTGVRSLTGLTPGDLYPIQIQQVTAIGESPWSDVKSVTPLAAPTAPAAFTAPDWTLTAIAGGVRISIASLPSNGGSAITALERQVNGGSWGAMAGTGTGDRDVTGLPESLTSVKIRAVNTVGAGPDSDTKTATPLAGGGSLAVVQAAPPFEQVWGTTATATFGAAVTNGNSIVVVAYASNGAGVPTISDSAGGSWGAPTRSYNDGSNTTFYWVRNGVTDGPTWVRGTIGSNGGWHICAYEVSGAGAGLVEDAFGSGAQAASSTWNMAFTSTVANTLCVAMMSVENASTPTGVAPMTAATATGGYQVFARGIFPTAGSNTATVGLSASWAGTRSWLVLRGS